MTAEKNGERIAVEIKSFLKKSTLQDLKEALGQFLLYEDALQLTPDHAGRPLYLAVRETVFETVFGTEVGKMVLKNRRARLIVFDPETEVIIQWIP